MLKRLECPFAEVYLIYNTPANRIRDAMKKVFPGGVTLREDFGKTCAGEAWTMESSKGSRVFFVWIDTTIIKKYIPEVITHETMHIVVLVSDFIGTNVSDSQGEWAAYMQQSLFSQCINLINNKKSYVRKANKKSRQ